MRPARLIATFGNEMNPLFRFGVPALMIVWGIWFFRCYTRQLAKEQKEFGERHGISRGISEGFHFYSAKVAAIAVATLGIAILLWQLFGHR